ncbi:MAG: glycosyltransferase family 4 protein [Solirubrobacteraceae bacterium]
MRVSQVLCAAGPVDAVTNQGLAFRRLFSHWGWDGEDYAAVVAPDMPRRMIRPLHDFVPDDREVVLLHYSGYARGLERLFEPSRRSLLISHNITPAQYFWAHEPVEGVRCELARSQLAELGLKVGALAGVSAFNAQELRELTGRAADVVPILFDRARLGLPGAPPGGAPTILFVGRLTPHKRQDLVIRAFAHYRELEPRARLVLVGVPLSAEFQRGLAQLADELAPGAVSFETAIASELLAERYRQAHAFLCLSEHEGFCIPLLEALHFRVPVVARAAGAVGEVVGEAGVLLGTDDSLQTVAELLRIVIDDDELRGELQARGERRLEVYEHARIAEQLRALVTTVAAA